MEATKNGALLQPTHTSCPLHPQTPPSSHEEKGSDVTSPNPWASSRNVERPIILQNGVYWNNAEARTSTSIVLLKVML